jgi:hypothetical protein
MPGHTGSGRPQRTPAMNAAHFSSRHRRAAARLIAAGLAASVMIGCASSDTTTQTSAAAAAAASTAVGVEPTTSAPTSSATPASSAALIDIAKPARAYANALRANDLDALVATFAPDAVIVDVQREIVGTDAIRQWADREVIPGRLSVLGVGESSADQQQLIVRWAPGTSTGWLAYYTFTYDNGLIARADLQYAPDDALELASPSADVLLAQRFTDALNTGDETAVRSAFSDNAQVDSVGRIYDGSEIVDRFLGPEVMAVSGWYSVRAITSSPSELVVEYDFHTPNYTERPFTYRYSMSDGVITGFIGDYVD